jgi:antitoxin component of MazEF toxin-antitoxin module
MLVADTITFRQRIRSRGRTSVAVTIPAEIYDRLLADYGDEVEVTIRAISEG